MNLIDIMENDNIFEDENIPQEDEYVNMSIEEFMDIVKHKRKIINLVYKINKSMRGKFKIDVKRIFNWIKNKSISSSKETSLENASAVMTAGAIIALCFVVIGILIWILDTIIGRGKSYGEIIEDIEKDKNKVIEELDKVYSIHNLTNGYKPDRIVSIVNKKDIDKYIKLCENIANDTINLLGSKTSNRFDDIEIKKSPKIYVEEKYKTYLKEFQFFIEEGKPTYNTFQKEHTIYHSIVTSSYESHRLKVTHQSVKDHGYKERDFDKYKKEWYNLLDNNKNSLINKVYHNVFNNIENFLNNPEHAKIILELCCVSIEKVGQELVYICLAQSEELNDEDLNTERKT